MKTILCREYQKDRILMDRMKSGNQNFVSGIRLTTLNALLKSDVREDREATLLQYSRLLRLKKEQFPLYSAMFGYPAFLEEILRFARQCILFQIPADQLPERSRREKELKQLLKEAFTLDLEEKRTIADLEDSIRKIEAMDPEIQTRFETDPFQAQVLKRLTADGVPCPPPAVLHPRRCLRYALSIRQEIEAAAQEICRNPRPCNVILCEPAGSLPVLRQVFRRYGIPFSSTGSRVVLKTPAVYAALADLARCRDVPHVLAAVKADAFSVRCPDQAVPFLEECMMQPGVCPAVSEHLKDSVFADSRRWYEPREKAAAEYFQRIRQELDLLLEESSAPDMLVHAFQVLQKSPLLKSRQELDAAMKIKRLLEHSLPAVKDAEDVRFLSQRIAGLEAEAAELKTDFCTVTDLQHPVPPAEVAYVLGCSGRSYPGFRNLSGLFDEDYASCLPGYPSLQERYEEYRDHLQWIESSAAAELIYSYPTNDYQGRAVELAFDVEATFPKDTEGHVLRSRWPLADTGHPYQAAHSLKPESARNLFLTDGAVYGSISSIERWFSCPYSYFIQSGLKVRDESPADLAPNTIGTIQHKVMEESARTLGKAYPDIPAEEMQKITAPYFALLDVMHPHEAWKNALTRQRMVSGLQNAMVFLKDMEQDSSFQPQEEEYHFKMPVTADDPRVILSGSIDRMDVYQDILRILDYKSSDHRLSEKSLKAGLQLQLLSYLMAAAQITGRTPAGAYYFSLKEVSSKLYAYQWKNKQWQEYDPAMKRAAYLKSRCMHGWTFEPRTTELDASEAHVSPKVSKLFSWPLSKQCLEELYRYFRNHLLAGDISLSPQMNACMFCVYRPVCRYHGDYRAAQPLALADQSLGIQKGSRK
jgi:ATP-dependent helicase/nuclease subunit B